MSSTFGLGGEPAPAVAAKSRRLTWRTIAIAAIVSAIISFFLGCATPASAQTPSAPAVRIADAAQPAGVLVDPIVCLERAAVVFKDAKKASKYCSKIYHSGGKVMEKVANEAADATKHNWPPVVLSPYGGSCGGCSGGPYTTGTTIYTGPAGQNVRW